jgi:hypothetical protein
LSVEPAYAKLNLQESAMSENIMLQEAVAAIRQGQRSRARDLLTRLLRADQSNPEYWLWMSSVVESTKEQIYCLQSVLRLDPNNSAARQGLVMLGGMPADPQLAPVPPVRRKWAVAVADVPRPRGLQAIWTNPVLRGAVFIALSAVVVFLMISGFIGWNRRPRAVAVYPTRTPGPSPTYTLTPTFVNYTPVATTPAPTVSGPAPLSAQLAVPYTATPRYVDTPHPASEAYQIGMRALKRGDLEAAFASLKQASQSNPAQPTSCTTSAKCCEPRPNRVKPSVITSRRLKPTPALRQLSWGGRWLARK